ncbi:hypothetical protein DNTS_015955, partial [Danionella cerebrum]
MLFSDDVISLASSSLLVDDAEEDEELRAAASHLCRTESGEDRSGSELERDGERASPTKRPSLELLLGALPTAASLGLSESISKAGDEKENDVAEESEKEERIAKEKEDGTYKEPKKHRKPKRRLDPINASTADEAIEKMLERKRISSKINYDVLKDINKPNQKSPSHKPEDTTIESKRTLAARRKPQLNPSISKTISSFGKRYGSFHQWRLLKILSTLWYTLRLQPLVCAQPTKKLALDHNLSGNPVAAPSVPAPEAVVVESGPVAYEDPGDEDEDDEEEEFCVSAMQLMGGT